MPAARAGSAGLFGLLVLLVWGAVGSGTPAPPRVAVADASDSKVRALLKERHAALQEIAAQTLKQHEAGQASFDQLCEAKQAVLRGALDLCETDTERVRVLEKLLALAQEQEHAADARVQAGLAPALVALRSRVDRLGAGIALERARAK